jgi:Flp pilus assembly protein TadD
MYALAMARFHAATSLHQCEAGRPAAALAAQLLPTDNAAWSALAAAQLACGEPSAAVAAAREAVRLAPASPEAAYHLGRALAALGERDAAREALVAAADLAPASEWRARAERQLEALGL